MKGDSTCRIYTEAGRNNYDKIFKRDKTSRLIEGECAKCKKEKLMWDDELICLSCGWVR